MIDCDFIEFSPEGSEWRISLYDTTQLAPEGHFGEMVPKHIETFTKIYGDFTLDNIQERIADTWFLEDGMIWVRAKEGERFTITTVHEHRLEFT